MKRIGLFGGSFDPIHLGHLLLAEICRESLQLDTICFVPAAISPLKQGKHPTEDKHRIEMIRLAIGGNSSFRLEPCEIERGGISYTIDTVKYLQSQSPQSDWFLLMGADSLQSIQKWKSPSELLSMVSLGVIARGGEEPPSPQILQGIVPDEWVESRLHLVESPVLEISSTELRTRVKEGKSIRYQVPPSVEAYIRQHGLYAASETAAIETEANGNRLI